MYQPKKYQNDDSHFIFNFIREYPFATIVLQGSKMMATHIPVLIEGSAEDFRLYAHIANHNPMWDHLENEKEILVIFKSPDAYISSSWYTNPDIPTWDYAAVHVNARLQLQTDKELQRSLENLISHFEKGQENPLDINQIPEKVWNENFKEITGFWLTPTSVSGVAKFHQGFQQKDLQNISKQLNKQSTCPMEKVSALIKKHN